VFICSFLKKADNSTTKMKKKSKNEMKNRNKKGPGRIRKILKTIINSPTPKLGEEFK